MKNTHIDLVNELSALNEKGKYDELIKSAASFHFHDFKNPPDIPMPKMHLVNELSKFPELSHIREQVMNLEYDEL